MSSGGATRQARKIPIKYTPFSDETLVLIKKSAFIVPLCLIPLAFFYPNFSLVLFLVFLVFYLRYSSYVPLPLFEKQKKDCFEKPDKLPLVFIGNDEFGYPIEIPVTIFKQHTFLMGSTGSGKTSLIRLILHSFLKWGGGCCFIDGKADVADMYQIFYSEVCECDRLEDFYVINFLNPSESHSLNPLAYGDADFLCEVLNGLLPPAQGDQVYWQQRGIELMRALITVLVWLRDNQDFRLTFSEIRRNMTLKAMVELALREDIPLKDEKGKPVRERLILYLESLTPNWRNFAGEGEMTDDMAEAVRQFGYGVQQWSSTLDLFYATYKQIFDVENPDVDIKDVVLNNKILYILLPALKQSQQTLASIGRLLVSLFKIVFSELIGDRVVGEARKLHEMVKAVKPDPPFLLILDEAGSYIPEDVDNVLAQARSTGVAVLISVQELASLKKGGEILEKRVLNNTAMKICLRVDDPEAAKYYVERADKEWTIIPSLRKEYGEFFDRVGNLDGTLSYDLRERIQPIDLYKLEPGHGYIMYLDEFRKFYAPYVKPKRPERMFFYRFIVLENEENYEELRKRYRPFVVRVEGNEIVVNDWTGKELKGIFDFDEKYQITRFLRARGVSEKREVEGWKRNFDDFVTLLVSEMMKDEDFLKQATPDRKIYEEFRNVIFSVAGASVDSAEKENENSY